MLNELPPLGDIRSIQASGGFIQLGKIVEHRWHEGHQWTLVSWVDIRRDAEWVPTSTIPPPLTGPGGLGSLLNV